jgi:hypothetical protein
MITISYHVSHWCNKDPKELSADDFDYGCFLGDVKIVLGDAVIDASWGWVPIGQFLTLLLVAMSDLLRGELRAEVTFTENEAAIYFQRDGGEVYVTTSFTEVVGCADLAGLRDCSVQSAAEFFDEIIQRYPSLLDNKIIVQRLQLIADVRRLTAA